MSREFLSVFKEKEPECFEIMADDDGLSKKLSSIGYRDKSSEKLEIIEDQIILWIRSLEREMLKKSHEIHAIESELKGVDLRFNWVEKRISQAEYVCAEAKAISMLREYALEEDREMLSRALRAIQSGGYGKEFGQPQDALEKTRLALKQELFGLRMARENIPDRIERQKEIIEESGQLCNEVMMSLMDENLQKLVQRKVELNNRFRESGTKLTLRRIGDIAKKRLEKIEEKINEIKRKGNSQEEKRRLKENHIWVKQKILKACQKEMSTLKEAEILEVFELAFEQKLGIEVESDFEKAKKLLLSRQEEYEIESNIRQDIEDSAPIFQDKLRREVARLEEIEMEAELINEKISQLEEKAKTLEAKNDRRTQKLAESFEFLNKKAASTIEKYQEERRKILNSRFELAQKLHAGERKACVINNKILDLQNIARGNFETSDYEMNLWSIARFLKIFQNRELDGGRSCDFRFSGNDSEMEFYLKDAVFYLKFNYQGKDYDIAFYDDDIYRSPGHVLRKRGYKNSEPCLLGLRDCSAVSCNDEEITPEICEYATLKIRRLIDSLQPVDRDDLRGTPEIMINVADIARTFPDKFLLTCLDGYYLLRNENGSYDLFDQKGMLLDKRDSAYNIALDSIMRDSGLLKNSQGLEIATCIDVLERCCPGFSKFKVVSGDFDYIFDISRKNNPVFRENKGEKGVDIDLMDLNSTEALKELVRHLQCEYLAQKDMFNCDELRHPSLDCNIKINEETLAPEMFKGEERVNWDIEEFAKMVENCVERNMRVRSNSNQEKPVKVTLDYAREKGWKVLGLSNLDKEKSKSAQHLNRPERESEQRPKSAENKPSPKLKRARSIKNLFGLVPERQ